MVHPDGHGARDGGGGKRDHAFSTTGSEFVHRNHERVAPGRRSGWRLAHGPDRGSQAESGGPRLEPAHITVRWTAMGSQVTAAFSMELRHGDTSLAAGIAQRYPAGPVILNTPAVQTNFGPASTAFWKQVYREMAGVMAEAGVTPYLQFGEVQWWYFADRSGMPFYDDFTKSSFQATYGRSLPVIAQPECRSGAVLAGVRFSGGLDRTIYRRR